jgi:pectate lyase
VRPEGRRYLAPEPFSPLMVEALAPEAALKRVLASAGATAPRRDPLDARVIQEVTNRTGHVINDPAEVGGWPALRSGPVLADADGDGMPDRWEAAHGSDPRGFDAWQDVDGNGWADLEDYLNQRADPSLLPQGNPDHRAVGD